MNKTIKTLSSWLEKSERILLVGQTHWTIDDASAILALHQVLTQNGKTVAALAPNKVPDQIQFLDHSNKVRQTLNQKNTFVITLNTNANQIADINHVVDNDHVNIVITGKESALTPNDIQFKKSAENFDAIITLGVPSLNALGALYPDNQGLFANTPIINISTDITTETFGQVNVIEPRYSSLGEIITAVITQTPKFSANFTDTTATTLLTGILSATDSFLAPNTTDIALNTAALLQENGADQSLIIEHLFKEKTPANLRTLGKILNNLEYSDSHRFAWATLSTNDLESINVTPTDIDHWSDQLLRHIDGSDIFALMVEDNDQTHLQIRTHNPNTDLETLAQNFSHIIPNANGFDCTITSPLETAQTTVLSTLKPFQSQRLRIETNTPITTLDLSQAMPPKSTEKKAPAKPASAKIPSNIPFEFN